MGFRGFNRSMGYSWDLGALIGYSRDLIGLNRT